MLSATSWIIGTSASMVLLFCIIFGIINLYHAHKKEAKLLYYAGIMILCTGGFYLGATVDFLLILFTGYNLANETGIHGILSFMWVAPAVISAMYLGGELIIPNKKKYIVIIYVILAIIFEIFLFVDTMGSFEFKEPTISGTELIDSSFVLGHPTFILVAIFLISAFLFTGVGFLIKAIQSSGKIRRNFIFLAIGFMTFVVCGALDSLIAPGPLLIIIRLGMISYTILMYFGLKPS